MTAFADAFDATVVDIVRHANERLEAVIAAKVSEGVDLSRMMATEGVDLSRMMATEGVDFCPDVVLMRGLMVDGAEVWRGEWRRKDLSFTWHEEPPR